MRFSAVIVVLTAAFATTTSAVLLESRQSGYASCAIPCLTGQNDAGCATSQTACLCKDNAFVQQTTACFQSKCSGTDLQQSLQAAQQMCAAVGVTLTSSLSGTPTSSSTKPSSTSSTSTNSADSNGVNALFVLGALGLIGYAL